jgi:hypothetical protein
MSNRTPQVNYQRGGKTGVLNKLGISSEKIIIYPT